MTTQKTNKKSLERIFNSLISLHKNDIPEKGMFVRTLMEYAYSVVHNAVSRRVLKHLVGEGVVSDDCFETIYFWH